MMELYIETLTGTAFELRVSPFETIHSVKAKIQRLEGIPISQQHLIWQTIELDDDYCLHDYEIHNGATLKLVLAMRGGPINTRRVPIEDSSLMEYMESAAPEELYEKLPGSRQVTLLVFREGDQLNFFRVVDRGDGTLTPLSESLSAASMYNMYDEEDDGENSNKEKSEENARIKEKMNSLRHKMENLSIAKKSRGGLQAPMSAAPPVLTVPTSSSRLQAIQSAHVKPTSALNRNRCLPPVSTSQKPPSATKRSSASGAAGPSSDHDYASKIDMDKKSLAANNNTPHASQPVKSNMLTELTIPKPPAEARTAHHDKSQRLHHRLLTTQRPSEVSTEPEASTSAAPIKSSSAKMLRRADPEKSLLKKQDSSSIINSIPEISTEHSDPLSPVAGTSGTGRLPKRKEGVSLEKLKGSLRGPANTEVAAGVSAGSATPHLVRRTSSRQHEMRASSRQQADLTIETLKDSFCSQRITLESLSSNEAKVMSGLLQQASLEKLGTSSISNFSPVRTRKGVGAVPLLSSGGNSAAAGNAAASMAYSNYHTMEELAGNRSANVGSRPMPESLENIGSSSAKLPPVKSNKKKAGKTSKRCFLCAKKTGLATSYICRCGNNFCAAHRYAELHNCTFDYKTEGRQLLEQSNPVVSAPKLPKI